MFDRKNIRNSVSRVLRKTRNFLLSRRCRESLFFLFFVVVSFCFWLLRVLNDDYETEFAIPLRLENVPGNVVLTSEPPDELRVTVKDRGTVLANYMLGQTFHPLALDFKEYVDRGTRVRIPVAALSKEITKQLSPSTRLLAMRPDTLEYIYTEGKAKKVPVRLQGKIVPDRQYYVSDVVYSPDSVMVYAPREILDTITAAYTRDPGLKNITDTATCRVGLADVKGAKFTPSYSDVTELVDIYAEKTVEIPVRGINFPAGKALRTFPARVQATFQVGLSHFMSVNEEDFFIGVTYESLLENKTTKCPVHVKSVPRYVNHVRLNPKEVDYIIEQVNVDSEND